MLKLNDKGKQSGDDLKSRIAKKKVGKKKIRDIKNTAGNKQGFISGNKGGIIAGKLKSY
jgi:hypothetical protein